MHPQPSNWTTSAANAAWFIDRGLQPPKVCHTDGWTFLYSVQSVLLEQVREHGGSLPSFNGLVRADDVPVNDEDPSGPNVGWNVPTLRALHAVGQRLRAPSRYLNAVRADASARRVSAETLQLAAWIESAGRHITADNRIVYSGNPDIVDLGPTPSLPAFDVPIPRPPPGRGVGVFCRDLPASADPGHASVSATPISTWIVAGILAAGALGMVALSKDVRGRQVRG